MSDRSECERFARQLVGELNNLPPDVWEQRLTSALEWAVTVEREECAVLARGKFTFSNAHNGATTYSEPLDKAILRRETRWP